MSQFNSVEIKKRLDKIRKYKPERIFASLFNSEYVTDGITKAFGLSSFITRRFIVEVGTAASVRSVQSVAGRLDTEQKFRLMFLFGKTSKESSEIRNCLYSKRFDNDSLVVVDASDVSFDSCGLFEFEELLARWEDLDRKTELVRGWLENISKAPVEIHYLKKKFKCDGRKEIEETLIQITKERFPNSIDNLFDRISDEKFFSLDSKLDVGFSVGATKNFESKFTKNVYETTFTELSFFDNFGLDYRNEDTPLSKIKLELDEFISKRFKSHGSVYISELTQFLVKEKGFSPNNFYSMVIGFLLRDYLTSDYRLLSCCSNDVNLTAKRLGQEFKFTLMHLNPTSPNDMSYAHIYPWNETNRRFIKFIDDIVGGKESTGFGGALIKFANFLNEIKTPYFAFKRLVGDESKKALDILHKTMLVEPENHPLRRVSRFVDYLTEDVERELKEAIRRENADQALYQTIVDIDRTGFIKNNGGTYEDAIGAYRYNFKFDSYCLFDEETVDNELNLNLDMSMIELEVRLHPEHMKNYHLIKDKR